MIGVFKKWVSIHFNKTEENYVIEFINIVTVCVNESGPLDIIHDNTQKHNIRDFSKYDDVIAYSR